MNGFKESFGINFLFQYRGDMKKFIKKNSYSFLLTLFDDDPYWTENIREEDFWTEFQKTLTSLPKVYRFGFICGIILLSIITPPYGFFTPISKSCLDKRKNWINSWANSKYIWKKSLFLGIRILIMGSALQLKPSLIHTNYPQILDTREKHICLKVKQ